MKISKAYINGAIEELRADGWSVQINRPGDGKTRYEMWRPAQPARLKRHNPQDIYLVGPKELRAFIAGYRAQKEIAL
jgi:hypothetical protein